MNTSIGDFRLCSFKRLKLMVSLRIEFSFQRRNKLFCFRHCSRIHELLSTKRVALHLTSKSYQVEISEYQRCLL